MVLQLKYGVIRIPKGPSFRPVTLKGNCRFNHVSDFLNDHGACSSQLMSEFYWKMDMAEILKIRTSPSQRQHFRAWPSDRNEQCSVQITYYLAMANHEDAFGECCFKLQP